MFKSRKDTLTLSLIRFKKASRGLRVSAKKMRKILRTGIGTSAQAYRAARLCSDAYVRLHTGDFKDDSDWSGIPATYQVFYREMSALLTGFDRYLNDNLASPTFQQQCLDEMALLSSADTFCGGSVVFEMRSGPHFRTTCVQFYQPAVITRKASNGMPAYECTVVQTPRWVHAVMRADCDNGSNLAGRLASVDCLPVPSPDVLVYALQLWQDAPSDGVYANFFDALTAVQMLI